MRFMEWLRLALGGGVNYRWRDLGVPIVCWLLIGVFGLLEAAVIAEVIQCWPRCGYSCQRG